MSVLFTVSAPLAGRAVALSDVNDDVFATGMVGWGAAIDPGEAEHFMVTSPCGGVVSTVFPHAFALDLDTGDQILVHLGMETIALKGEGFTPVVVPGQRVERGQDMIGWDTRPAREREIDLLSPVVVVQVPSERIEVSAALGSSVSIGQTLFTVRL
ncbi:PTS sugar transporter subunit IIA [Jonesia quinghaiensis]|uniref:PTS sugar transporter subunit IIA n=1 Tax=Jonesia quinghaiensis TaxID=262806 RepID=UPI0004058D25|nr:PTS glucose transporter subunit IIA [Jonesia quinghaiensis]